jgi:hypothetical protein
MPPLGVSMVSVRAQSFIQASGASACCFALVLLSQLEVQALHHDHVDCALRLQVWLLACTIIRRLLVFYSNARVERGDGTISCLHCSAKPGTTLGGSVLGLDSHQHMIVRRCCRWIMLMV